MSVLTQTTSVCPTCRALVPTRVEAEGPRVYFRKFCPTHGESRVLVHGDSAQYLQAQHYIKPAWVPDAFSGSAAAACPEGCGFCSRHEQHLCMPIVEITTRCNLACPICINSSGSSHGSRTAPWDLSLMEFRRILDTIIAAEHQIDVLNFSGGEPLLHPQLIALVDEALARKEIVRISISTNGLALLARPELLEGLRQRNIVISLQFDGFDDAAYQLLRGRPLLREKMELLDLLGDAGLTTTLTMTLAGDVNERQLPAMLETLFTRDHVVSLMLQPLAFTGRAVGMTDAARRLTIPDVVTLLGEAGHPSVKCGDFLPLPCSHPLCFSLAFYLMLKDGRAVSISQLTDAATMMDAVANKVFFGLDESEHEQLKQFIYQLWSGPVGAVPEGPAVLATLRGLLREISCGSACGFDSRRSFTRMERKIKSIFIHAFQDVDTFDLARVRRCCQAYPQPDGSLVPACVQNVLRRQPPAMREVMT